MPIKTATPETIAEAAHLLRAGALVAFPTETVYGLGADARNGEAVAQIFAAKGRPHFNPLIVHVPHLKAAMSIGDFSPDVARLADSFWPGPLTLVVPRKLGGGISDLVTAGLETIALRVPAHPVAQALLHAFGGPIAAPSANRSGHVSATLARHVAEDLGERVALVVDGGAVRHGLESTIIDASGPSLRVLRPGAIATCDLERAIGKHLNKESGAPERPIAPGQLSSHYAPRAQLRLDATSVEPGEAQLAFGPALPSQGIIINLSPAGDMVEAASNLFSALRALDAMGAQRVAVMPIPLQGLGEAINDRLRRAAAPRN
jgi:L-threonylcarbamoyladenylate synthase